MSFTEVAVEPRKLFLTFQIKQLITIYEALYILKKGSLALAALKGLIDSLDEKSKTNLKDEYEKILNYQQTNTDIKNLEALYSTVTTYLHKTYLSEINMGVIPTSALSTEQKPPEPKHFKSKISAKV